MEVHKKTQLAHK